MAVRLLRRTFTVDDYHRMVRAGILTEDDRVELLEGEIVEMVPIGSRHQACVDRLNELLARRAAEQAILRVQGPIVLGERSEPQPDLILLRRRPDFYATSHPRPQHVLLVIEVAETSADYDRQVKMPLYARAGVPEVWLVDLEGQAVEVYRKPAGGTYEDMRRLQAPHRLSVEALPRAEVAIEEILG